VIATRTTRSRRLVVAIAMATLLSALPTPVSAATVFSDGFESASLAAWSGSTGFSVQQTTVRSGSWAGRASSTGAASYAWKTFTTQPELWSETWFNVEARSTAVWLAAFRKAGGGAILLVGLDGGGRLIAKNLVTKTVFRSTVGVTGSVWHELDIHMKTGTGGRFDVTLDGAPVPALSRSTDLGTMSAGRFAVGDQSTGRTYSVAFDDISVANDAGPPDDSGATIGRWSQPVDVGVVGVHSVVLHTGKVLLFFKTTRTTKTAVLFDPASGAVTDVSPPVTMEYNMFCSAHVSRPNGDVFVVGGNGWGMPYDYGTQRTAFFDPDTETWRSGPPMAEARWYPTVATVQDGDALVFSGLIDPGTTAATVERYDGGTRTFSTLPTAATRAMMWYPRMFLLPDGRLVRVGQDQETMFFDPDTATWSDGPSMAYGWRYRGTAIQLPGLERFLAIGGSRDPAVETTRSTEILDLGAPTPGWRASGDLNVARRNLNAVLLPDGKVLAVGGNQGTGLYDDPVLAAELFDPASERWTLMASQNAPRAYHSTAVLLPDGRVLSAGQTNGTSQTTIEMYSPPYLFAGGRPVIERAPANISYGTSFDLTTPDASTVDGVVLIRANTATHGVNFDQRSVDLSFVAGASSLRVSSPSSALEAPPGWYMLFVLRGGVPSIAKWMHVA
jgi:hypothetical protein